MARGRELSAEQRREIIVLYKQKRSLRKIGNIVNRSPSTVKYTIDRYTQTKSNCNRPGRGRLSLLSENDHCYIRLISRRNRRKTLPEITDEFNCGRKWPVSHSTIRKSLLKWGIKGCVASKKPLLRPQNILKRLAFAKKHVKWTKKQWRRVLFTEEIKFELFSTKRRIFVRRLPGERFKKNA